MLYIRNLILPGSTTKTTLLIYEVGGPPTKRRASRAKSAEGATLDSDRPCGGFPLWGFPKIRGTILGVPRIRTIVFWGLYWGPPILGNYRVLFGVPHNADYSIWGSKLVSLHVGKLPFGGFEL